MPTRLDVLLHRRKSAFAGLAVNDVTVGEPGAGMPDPPARPVTGDVLPPTPVVSLPTRPPIGSLNVSNAAAIGLYEIARRRPR